MYGKHFASKQQVSFVINLNLKKKKNPPKMVHMLSHNFTDFEKDYNKERNIVQ